MLGAAGSQTGLNLRKAGSHECSGSGLGLKQDAAATQGPVVEQRHVEVIPENARHGRPRDQFTLWFATNANVFNFVLGGFAILFGLNVFWALIAMFVGAFLGLAFTRCTPIQGPRLGVPQMIQSRGQFGFYGAKLHSARVDRARHRGTWRPPQVPAGAIHCTSWCPA